MKPEIPAILDDCLFTTVEHAIRFASRTERRDIVKVSSYFGGLRGSTVKRRRATGPWEAHAQAAMILAMLERRLRGPEMIAIRARYTVPASFVLELRKAVDCRVLTEHILGIRKLPRDFVQDACREWAGYRREQSDAQWAHRLGVHLKTLYYWRVGVANRSWPGVGKTLDSLEAAGMSHLYQPMVDAGLVGP